MAIADLTQKEQDALVKLSEIFSFQKPFSEVMGIKPESLETVYAVGHLYYEQGKYDQALQIFQLLSVLDSDNLKFWKAYAGALQMVDRLTDAITAYSFCVYLDATDPEVPFHAGKCYLALGDLAKAQMAFQGAAYFAKMNPKKYANLEKQADLYIKAILEKGGKA
ncbi:MAG: SycD/LcrH family type III secretion system chaperone [Alphaproteobacteria bacterium]|jgi:type III secretion system low calcium response chaperone LcrH/SycD|nr:SycD/LcrH family type III secretion system chaperone [Alphaproteobacteria bacterium]MBP9876811.1 SycD/LcrH family type III secretion system chaperone [Alphaproteobacteria bacterium]